MLISNMTIAFLKFQSKNIKSGSFGVQIYGFLFLNQTLQQDKFEDFKYNNSISKLQPKIRKEVFLFPNSRIFLLHQTLRLNKFECVNFKYDNGFFQFQSEKSIFCRKSQYFLFLLETSHI